jgi:hypothetical protein
LSVSKDGFVWLDDNILSQVSFDLWCQLVILDVDLSGSGRNNRIREKYGVVGNTAQSQSIANDASR